ncbi:MAG: serine/threonine-protein kinase [Pyrinomonadaceae bacterium]
MPPDDSNDPGLTEPTQPAADSTAATVTNAASQDSEFTLVPPVGLVGTTLAGRYYVESELGQGGIGAVYLARDRKLLDKKVVVKVLLEKTLQNEWATRKFQHEKEALARVDHPGIVSVLDDGTLANGEPYLVMQYVEGETLRSIMRTEGADLDRSARLIEQIGQALSAAHADGIVHRDLKPENIMIQPLPGSREQAKVIDFGIARVRDSQLAPSTAIAATAGTIAYMSPEQLRAEKVGATSDVYALGIIAYELVAGRRPFNPESVYQLLDMQREGVRVKPKDLRPALPEAAQAVILKALAFDLADRYQSAADFGNDFEAAISGVGMPRGLVDPESPTKTLPTQPAMPTLPAPPVRVTDLPGSPSWLDVPVTLKPKPPIALIAIVALLLVGVIAVGLWWALRSKSTTMPPKADQTTDAGPKLELNYWLSVQKMRDGKEYQVPFESSGQEIFENGWKFRFNAASPQSGYLYLLNEGPDAAGKTSYNLLFPMPSLNSGTAQLAVGQPMQTGWYVFDDHQGTERFWIVWSPQPVPELEAVKGVANPTDRGTITDPKQEAGVRDLLGRSGSTKPEVSKDTAKKQTNVRSKGDVLVNLIELEHH